MCYQTTAFLPLSTSHNTFSHTVKASGPVHEGFRLMNSTRFSNTLSTSHTHMEALTFEGVFVKSAPLHVCLSEDAGDFSDNGPMTPIDSIRGSEGQWNKGPGVHQQTSDWLTNTPTNTNNRSIVWTIRSCSGFSDESVLMLNQRFLVKMHQKGNDRSALAEVCLRHNTRAVSVIKVFLF